MELLKADFHRFCKLHSWYKHIPFEGKDFYVYQDQGQQPRNGICPEYVEFQDPKPIEELYLKEGAKYGMI